MRYRELSADGDLIMGRVDQFLINTPAAVAQAILTRLRLAVGQWFLDLDEGTDYAGSILGRSSSTRDFEVQQRILGTPGVLSITNYFSTLEARRFTVTAEVSTVYGTAQVSATL